MACWTYLVVSAVSLQEESDRLLVIPPAVEGDSYCVEISTGAPLSLKLITGVCSVNGRSLVQAPLTLSPGN